MHVLFQETAGAIVQREGQLESPSVTCFIGPVSFSHPKCRNAVQSSTIASGGDAARPSAGEGSIMVRLLSDAIPFPGSLQFPLSKAMGLKATAALL